jgi:hypothetical protein
VLQKVGRTWKEIERGGLSEDRRCLVVDDPRKSGGVDGIRIRKRVGFSKGTVCLSMAVRLNTRKGIINALTKRNLLVNFGLQTGVRHSDSGVRIS